jgi:oligoendopeptidase F
MSNAKNQSLPSWDLTQYYQSHTDSAIDSDLISAQTLVAEFVTSYKGKVGELTASQLFVALTQQEKVLVSLFKPSYYLHTIYEGGGEDVAEIGKKQVSINEQTTVIANELAFWDVELSARKDLLELSQSQELMKFSYILKQTHEQAKYVLSEEVEKVLNLKSLTSSEAWSKLYTDMKGKIEVTHDFGDGEKVYRTPDLSVKLMDTNREVRKQAWSLIAGAYEKNEDIVLEAYNNILLDCKIRDSLRGFKDCEDSKLLSNQVSRKVVDSLIDSITRHAVYYQDYLKVKQQILGVESMYYYDVNAEIGFEGVDGLEYSWEDCQKIILEAFETFDTDFAAIAREFFEKHWIDAVGRKQKYGGAFMSDFAPEYHPVILCNFKGRFEDILTVAHELGHGIHSVLMNRKQTYLNCHYAMTVAEIASLCCETVVFNALIKNVTDPKLRLKLLCTKFEQEAGNIFIGGLGRYLFERDAHVTYRAKGPLSKEQVREMWLKNYYGAMFGDVVVPGDGAEFTWQGVAHFTYIFYNYVYASGSLISSSIFKVLQEQPEKIDVYKEMLALGGSVSPVELLKHMDMDIEQPEFWDIGFKILIHQLKEIQTIWAEINVKV